MGPPAMRRGLGSWGSVDLSPPTGHHLLPALPRGLPWAQLLPGMSLSQRRPLRPIHGAVSLCSGIHGGPVSGVSPGVSEGCGGGWGRRLPGSLPRGAQVPRGVPRGPLRAGLRWDVRLRPGRPLLPGQRRVSVRTRLHRGPLRRAPLPRRPLRPQLPGALHLRAGTQPQVGRATLRPKGQEASGEAFSAEAAQGTKSTGGISWAGAGHGCGRGDRAGPRGPGCGGPPSERRGASLITPSTPRCSAPTTRRRRWAWGRSAGTPAQTAPRPRLRPQLPPDERGVLVPAGLGGPPLQRELPAGHARAGLPGALPLPSRRRLPARQRPLPVRARLHGEDSPAAREVRGRPRESARPSHECAHPPPTFRDRTALASAPLTPTESTAPHAVPAKMPSPARPSTAPASARKVLGWGLLEGRFGGAALGRRESPRAGAGQG